MPIPKWSDFKSWKTFYSTVPPFAFLMGIYGSSREGQGLLMGIYAGLILAAMIGGIGGIVYGTLYLAKGRKSSGGTETISPKESEVKPVEVKEVAEPGKTTVTVIGWVLIVLSSFAVFYFLDALYRIEQEWRSPKILSVRIYCQQQHIDYNLFRQLTPKRQLPPSPGYNRAVLITGMTLAVAIIILWLFLMYGRKPWARWGLIGIYGANSISVAAIAYFSQLSRIGVYELLLATGVILFLLKAESVKRHMSFTSYRDK